MSLLKDLKEFAIKGNMVDLAVGVIIGGAFGKTISSIVDDLIMPLLNPLMPKGHWRAWTLGPGVRLGNFFGTLVDFLIVTAVIFGVVRLLHLRRKLHEAEKGATPSASDRLLTEIRDELRAVREALSRR